MVGKQKGSAKPPESNLFEGAIRYSLTPVRGVSVYRQAPRDTVEDLLAELDRQDIEATKRKELLNRLRLRVSETEEKLAKIERPSRNNEPTALTKPKRFNVVDGELIADDNGEYSLGEAVTIARAQRKESAVDVTQIISTLLTSLKPGESLKVSDLTGAIKDIMSLQPQGNSISMTEIQLQMENQALRQRDEMRQEVTSAVTEAVRRLMPASPPPRDSEEPPFIVDSDGGVRLNPKAKLSGNDVLAWHMMSRARSVYVQGPDGQMLPVDVDTHLKVKEFDNDQRRKDEEVEFKKSALEFAREQAPQAMEVLRNIRGPQPETMEALERGGWARRQDKAEVASAPCANCGTAIGFTPGTRMVQCPQCRETNFLGTQEELKAEVDKWTRSLSPQPSSTPSTPKSEDSSGLSSSSGSGGPSQPSSKRSKNRGSGGKS